MNRMALINPVHGLVVPFLFMFTLPLAIFAGVTSALAFSVLMFRAAIVYLDIALAFVPQYFLRGKSKSSFLSSADNQRRYSRGDGWRTPASPLSSARSSSSNHSPPSPFPQTTGHPNSGYISPRRKSSYGFRKHSRRSSSQVSISSPGTITPIHENHVLNDITTITPATFADASLPPATFADAVLTPSVGLDRDYEGIGGWRLDNNGSDSDWTSINSRLELAREGRAPFTRGHSRSHSAGPMPSPSGSYLTPRSGSRRGTIMNDINHDWLASTGGFGARTAGPTPNASTVRLNQTFPIPPPAFTTLEMESRIRHDLLSPRSVRKTPAA